MALKLSILKTGEYIISDLFQGTDDSGKVLAYLLHSPKLIIATTEYEKANSNELKTNVALLSWPSFTKDERVEVTYDSFIAHVDPTTELKTLYENSLK